MQSTSGKIYELGAELGSGAYGTVYSVKRDDGEHFAFKKFESSSVDLELGALREISILRILKNSPENCGLMKMEDFVVHNNKDNSIGIIMKLYKMDLCDAFKKKILDKKVYNSIALKTLEAVAFLHDNGIIHRDIKPENILLDQNCNPVLTDFTLSKVFTGVCLTGTHTGKIATVTYRAPEVVARKPYGFPADIWSLGVVFYELFSEKQLTAEKDKEVLDFFAKQIPKFKKGNIGNMIRGLLVFDPKERWTAKKALKSEILGKTSYVSNQIWKPMNKCKVRKEIEDMCENFEAEKKVSRWAAQTYVDRTGCSVHSAVELACKFYETDPISLGCEDFAEEEMIILNKMEYNLFI
jgi:serine/threonine protein kinase